MKNLDIRERVTQAQAAVLSDFQVEIPKIGLIRAMKTYPSVMNSLTGVAFFINILKTQNHRNFFETKKYQLQLLIEARETQLGCPH